jgi:hypothetical protein
MRLSIAFSPCSLQRGATIPGLIELTRAAIARDTTQLTAPQDIGPLRRTWPPSRRSPAALDVHFRHPTSTSDNLSRTHCED